MFGKIIVFGLSEMIQKKTKKTRVRTESPGPGWPPGWVGYDSASIHKYDEIMMIIFLSCVTMLVSKLSIVIRSTRLDIVDPNRLAHVILFD